VRLLVVEDEPGIVAFLRQGLTEEGFAVDVATDGEAAVDFALSAPYDVIILDLILPRKDGLEVCGELRRRGLATPILMLTARGTVDDKVQGLYAGADDYLVKPFAFPELLARLRALLRRPASALPAVLKVGDLSLDPGARRAERAGALIDLTPREFSLLELFMRHPGQVLTRTRIAEHIWNFDFCCQSNVVDVYVSYLRRKIEAGFQTKLVHTVRGVGYKMEVPSGR